MFRACDCIRLWAEHQIDLYAIPKTKDWVQPARWEFHMKLLAAATYHELQSSAEQIGALIETTYDNWNRVDAAIASALKKVWAPATETPAK